MGLRKIFIARYTVFTNLYVRLIQTLIFVKKTIVRRFPILMGCGWKENLWIKYYNRKVILSENKSLFRYKEKSHFNKWIPLYN